MESDGLGVDRTVYMGTLLAVIRASGRTTGIGGRTLCTSRPLGCVGSRVQRRERLLSAGGCLAFFTSMLVATGPVRSSRYFTTTSCPTAGLPLVLVF